MSRFIKDGNSKRYVYVTAFGILFLLWRGGDLMNDRLTRLPIRQIDSVKVKEPLLDVKAFYPVMFKNPVVVARDAAPTTTGTVVVDDLFQKKEPPRPEVTATKAPEPDYATLARNSIQFDGVTDNGAILNGQFYRINDSLDALGIVGANGQRIVPLLLNVTRDRALVRVGNKTVELHLQQPY